MAGPESIIEGSCVGVAKRYGWEAFKVQWLGRRGAPDRCFMGHGRTVFIEFKRAGKEPTAQQAKMADLMRANGLEVYAADNLKDALAYLGIAWPER